MFVCMRRGREVGALVCFLCVCVCVHVTEYALLLLMDAYFCQMMQSVQSSPLCLPTHLETHALLKNLANKEPVLPCFCTTNKHETGRQPKSGEEMSEIFTARCRKIMQGGG